VAIRTLLVANRGEIALRVFRTCARLGIATVAVAAEDDAASLHVRSADRVVSIASYLDPAEIVRAAREAGADAVHPGYGFLAESADLAAAVEEAGIVFVGPTPEQLRAAGDKERAKEIATAAGVPVVPWGAPEEIGFPLLVKAAAGGGGRGMRIVREPAELDEALAAAQREAETAFGDGRTFCERYLERPRHVEVQILGDGNGRVIALGDRDCSIQRRHQKLVEEAPAPGLDPALRAAIHNAAVAFGEALRYRGAGTVELAVTGGAFFFLELNGRIQVEHPVTEAVAGLDIVELQLRVAAGEGMDGVVGAVDGHAIEARLYAEDPRSFLPQAGRLERLVLPASVRVDAGVAEGDEVGTRYDPLLAKLVAHGATRMDAVDRLAAALADTQVEGVTTNLPFLRWLVAHPAFRDGTPTTAFLTEHPALSAVPLRRPAGPWAEPFRLNLPAPPPAPVPTVEHALEEQTAAGGTQRLLAPMPGTVLRVLVATGDEVAARQPLVVLEAMKMETPVSAPFAGRVTAVHAEEGASVAAGTLLVELES
jgi:acetyl/propionyl-CoA carboxylase alpha subunit